MAREQRARGAARRKDSRAKRNPEAGPARVSRLHEPEDMGVEAWQAALRRQFGREQDFELENLGEELVFSEFRVTNPDSGGVYRVAIRSAGLGDNFCSCPDFATNELGTCKHVEFTLSRLERKRGAKKALRAGFEPAFSELSLEYGARRRVRFRPGRDCPQRLRARARRLFDADAGWTLPPERFDQLDAFLSAARDGRHELRACDDALDFVRRRLEDEARRAELARCYPEGRDSSALQGLLQQPLYPYQAEGALFAASAGRAILADEMGLGKTIQALAGAELMRRHGGVVRTVVVCPTSLTRQWANEITRFAGRAVQIAAGSRKVRSRVYAAPADYLILSYDTLIRDFELVCAWQPDLLIADEAQRIKNWETRAARTLKRLPTRHAFVLTGTPLENRLEELVSIVQLVDRARLGPTWRFLRTHQERDETGRVIGYRALDEIGRTLAPILIRRRREEVLRELPERVEKTWFVPLTARQRDVHDDEAANVSRLVSKWRRQRFLSETDRKRLMASLQTMRMVCNSTWLVDGVSDHGSKVKEIVAVVGELLERPGAKVVVFSAWLKMHELLARAFDSAGWGHVHFHGGVPGAKRGQLVMRFRDDPECRIFLATDSGGVGLNLQFASAVVNVDLPWNPAVLRQRIGRVHRLGQRSTVQVENFVADDSIERRILGLLDFKDSLAAGALDGGDAVIALEGTKLTRFMENVENVIDGRAGEPDADPRRATTRPPEPTLPAAPEPTTASAPAHDGGSPRPEQADRDTDRDSDRDTESDNARTAPEPQASAAGGPTADPWQPLLALGARVLGELAQENTDGQLRVEQDPQTGQRYLKLPVPDPGAVRQLVDALQAFLPPRS